MYEYMWVWACVNAFSLLFVCQHQFCCSLRKHWFYYVNVLLNGFLRQRQVNQSQVTTATATEYSNPKKAKRISNEDKIAAAAAKDEEKKLCTEQPTVVMQCAKM